MIRVAALELPGIRHAFFTREGGVSEGLFASLNGSFGSSDAPERVAENRRRAAESLGLTGDRLVACAQIHSAEAVTVTAPWRHEDRPRADALATREAGIALGILTADCAPVLFADPTARVVGAAHAGWRGAVGGVLEATVAAMQRAGAEPRRIHAGIGPCIGPRSYEVGPEFPAPFLAESAENAACFTPAPRPGHYLFDLPGYVARRLARLGLGRIEAAGGDTAAEPARFFSYRRAHLNREGGFGHLLSAICLEA